MLTFLPSFLPTSNLPTFHSSIPTAFIHSFIHPSTLPWHLFIPLPQDNSTAGFTLPTSSHLISSHLISSHLKTHDPTPLIGPSSYVRPCKKRKKENSLQSTAPHTDAFDLPSAINQKKKKKKGGPERERGRGRGRERERERELSLSVLPSLHCQPKTSIISTA